MLAYTYVEPGRFEWREKPKPIPQAAKTETKASTAT